LERREGGRIGDKSTVGLSDQLRERNFEVVRLKTGTPARAYRNSINWSELTPQQGDERFQPFSLRSSRKLKLPQIECFVTHTNQETHDIIRRNLDKSPMFCGIIEGIGPRYCPSIEDKIHRFADKSSHQSFLEPEGLTTDSIYIQGISTSLPESVQYEFLRTMPGLKDVKLIIPGYAVEYDSVEPRQLHHTLETKKIQSLYLAGQVNSTSGYEEAAAQGLVAGTNAALKILGRDPMILSRSDAYIGVMIDDLVLKGTKEPYRMMTSRAEHRLVLREDNTLERLAEIAFKVGLVNSELRDRYLQLLERRIDFKQTLESKQLVPNEITQTKLRTMGTPVLLKPCSYAELLRRAEVSSLDLSNFDISIPDDIDVWEPVEIDVKYAGYIKRQNLYIEQASRMEQLRIPSDLDYTRVVGLSREEVEKLQAVKPLNLGQAQRVSGVNPSAIQAMLMHIKAIERAQIRK
ncbi:MAG: tRNA uridine-5-carboxymethylaminomethyl(34) synthesis enzyme MnmG, partial [Bdellovibrionota bacterium]